MLMLKGESSSRHQKVSPPVISSLRVARSCTANAEGAWYSCSGEMTKTFRKVWYNVLVHASHTRGGWNAIIGLLRVLNLLSVRNPNGFARCYVRKLSCSPASPLKVLLGCETLGWLFKFRNLVLSNALIKVELRNACNFSVTLFFARDYSKSNIMQTLVYVNPYPTPEGITWRNTWPLLFPPLIFLSRGGCSYT